MIGAAVRPKIKLSKKKERERNMIMCEYLNKFADDKFSFSVKKN